MRTLWVKPGGFLPLDTGGKIRSYHTVKELARRWPTTVITFYIEESNDQNPLLGQFVDKLITVPLKRNPAALTYAAAVLAKRPFMFEKFCRPAVRNAVAGELKKNGYDVIICDFLLGCGAVPFESSTPKVVFTHNVEARIWQRHYDVAPNLSRRLLARRERDTLAAIERKYLSEADMVLTVSEADRAEFIAWGLDGNRIFSVPTGVDTAFFAPAEQQKSCPTLVFTGSMDWMPNQDGILFFLEEVYPSILAKVPDVSFKIVGRRPPQKILQAASRFPGVTVTGWVEDIRQYLAEADVCVVPLRVGSGTRLKIFEAMSMGKAVVSTAIGAEGLPVTDASDILIADSAGEFAARTVELLHDEAKRSRIGKAARQLVEARYSWGAVTDKLMQIIENRLA